MKFNSLFMLAAAGLTLSAPADVFEPFDYANQAAFNAVWSADTGTGLTLQSGTAFAGNAILQSTTAASRVNRLMPGVQGNVLDFSFQFFDAGGSRDFAQLYSRSGTTWGSSLNGALSFGTFNTTPGSKYSARFTAATPANGGVFGDGATIISASDTTGWFSTSVTRANGWHLLEVIGSSDPNNAGKDKLSFYVDGVLGGSIANAPDQAFNFAVLGGANSTTVLGAAYDNFSVITVPEPGALAFSVLGGLAFAFRRISRPLQH